MKAVLDVISKGAAGSWQMENRGKTMVGRQVRLRVRGRLDAEGLRICLDEAARNSADLAVTKTIKGYYDEISGKGGGAGTRPASSDGCPRSGVLTAGPLFVFPDCGRRASTAPILWPGVRGALHAHPWRGYFCGRRARNPLAVSAALKASGGGA
jgi:hypothetical protein